MLREEKDWVLKNSRQVVECITDGCPGIVLQAKISQVGSCCCWVWWGCCCCWVWWWGCCCWVCTLVLLHPPAGRRHAASKVAQHVRALTVRTSMVC
jgi:hypothetical protein